MKRTVLSFAILALPLALAACGSDPKDPTDGNDAGGDGGSPGGDGGETEAGADADPGPPTFSRLYSDIIVRKCGGPACHNDTVGGNLVLTPTPANASAAWGELVGQPAAGAAEQNPCSDSGLIRVVPGEPDQSLLYLKLFDTAPCGDRMPLTSSLSEAEIEAIRLWIELGAENN